MGGFVFDLEEACLPERDRFTGKHSRLTVTPRGMALLARCGFVPRISKEDILDKNKSEAQFNPGMDITNIILIQLSSSHIHSLA